MSRMFWAPLGAVTALGKSGFDSLALRPITPPKLGAGIGRITEPPSAGGTLCASAGLDHSIQLPMTAAIATVSNKCRAKLMKASSTKFGAAGPIIQIGGIATSWTLVQP